MHLFNYNKNIKILLFTIISIFLINGVTFSEENRRGSGMLKIDLKQHHTNYLLSRGISDFSNDSLIYLLNNTNDTSVAYHIILLLGRKGAKEAIPEIKRWLTNKNITVQTASAEALLLLENSDGVEILEKICKQNDGNMYGIDASGVLARHGLESAIPYLMKFSTHDVYSYRLSAIEHMTKMVEKMDENESSTNHRVRNMRSANNALLVNRMNQLLSDGDIRVREKAVRHLSTIKLRNKKPILKALKERYPKERNTELAKQIEKSIERLEKEQFSDEK